MESSGGLGNLLERGGTGFKILLVPIAVFGFMAGGFAPAALASLADVSHKKKRGMTMGLYSFVISAAMTVGPILSGAVIDRWGGPGVLAFMTSIAMLMLALVLVQWWDRRRSAWEEGGGGGKGGGKGGKDEHGAAGVPGHGEEPPD